MQDEPTETLADSDHKVGRQERGSPRTVPCPWTGVASADLQSPFHSCAGVSRDNGHRRQPATEEELMGVHLPWGSASRSTMPWYAIAASCTALFLAAPAQAADQVVESQVTAVGPADQFPRNSNDEPAMAVDASRPNVLAIGAHELADNQACSQAAATSTGACTFRVNGLTTNAGVGITGVFFSFDSGHSWIQPTYQGLTAVGCDPTVEPCVPKVGPIHTVPNYYEHGLRTLGDPSLAFGPIPDQSGSFSWSNGSRLYVASVTTNLDNTNIGDEGQNNATTLTASFIDNVTPERIADQANWSRPYFVDPHTAAAAFMHKEAIWADNAASSPHFGNVYTCFTDQHSRSRGAATALFPNVATSTDGGVTWKARPVGPAVFNAEQGGRFGCTVRTDSNGVVYVFYNHFAFGFPGVGTHTMVKSLNGGHTWTPPSEIFEVNDACYAADPLPPFSCVMDGYTGTRIDVTSAPSVDIANGAPTGTDATNELVDVWGDGRLGFNNEAALLSYSTDSGESWSEPEVVSLPGDRALFTAPAIAPDGSRLYVVYMGLTAPFQATTVNPRPVHGVLLSAPVGADGAPGAWTTLYNGPAGDARGSGFLGVNREFLGDYVYAIATRTYGAGTWTDLRQSTNCTAVDAWRQKNLDEGARNFPAPWPLGVCPSNFGNTDIFSATTG